MDKETVLRLAREAGWPDSLVAPVIMAKLTEFAELVRAAEREACAKVCDELGKDMTEMSAWASFECAKQIRARNNT